MNNSWKKVVHVGIVISLIIIAGLLHKIYADASSSKELPKDPFQRAAVKALRGDYGKLEVWQKTGYSKGLKQGVKCTQKVFLTAYYPSEGRDSQIDRRGRRCSMRSAAANKVPENAYIWTKFGLRQVRDCGAHFNDRIAKSKKADFWADYWYPTPDDVPWRNSNKIWNKGVHAAAVIK